MIRDRERLDTSLDEIAVAAARRRFRHAAREAGDVEGVARTTVPEGVWLGWKNFDDEDHPMLTVEQTMEQVRPRPSFVSYQ